ILWGSFFADVSALTSSLEVHAELRMGARPADVNAASASHALGPSAPAPALAATPAPTLAAAPAPDPARSPSARPWSLRGRALWTFPQGPSLEVSCDTASGAPLDYSVRF